MARHVFSVLCRRSITDQGSNLLSLVDVLDSIMVAPEHAEAIVQGGVASLALDAWFVSLFTRSDLDKEEEMDVSVLLIGPKQQRLGETNSRIDLTRFQNFRMATKLDQMPFVGPGRYEFKVRAREGARWRTLTAFPFAVALQLDSQK